MRIIDRMPPSHTILVRAEEGKVLVHKGDCPIYSQLYTKELWCADSVDPESKYDEIPIEEVPEIARKLHNIK